MTDGLLENHLLSQPSSLRANSKFGESTVEELLQLNPEGLILVEGVLLDVDRVGAKSHRLSAQLSNPLLLGRHLLPNPRTHSSGRLYYSSHLQGVTLFPRAKEIYVRPLLAIVFRASGADVNPRTANSGDHQSTTLSVVLTTKTKTTTTISVWSFHCFAATKALETRTVSTRSPLPASSASPLLRSSPPSPYRVALP